jgi:hypothetical protein
VIERRFGIGIELVDANEELPTQEPDQASKDDTTTMASTTATEEAKEGPDGKAAEKEKEKASESIEKASADVVGSEPNAQARAEAWLDLSECLLLVRETAHRVPLSTLNLLFTEFGYDFRLHRNHYLSLEACWTALEDPAISFREIDRQLVQYLEHILSSTPDMARISDLRPTHVLPITPEHAHATSFARLIGRDTRLLRLRAELLKLFNTAMVQSLPLVDFNGRGVVSSLLSANRHLLLSAGKLDYFYDILDRTAVEGNQPTVNLNRVKIAAGKSKLESRLQTNDGGGLRSSSDSAAGHAGANLATNASKLTASSASQGMDQDVGALLKNTDDWVAKNTIFGAAYAQLTPSKTDAQLYRQKKPTGHNPHYSINILFQGENVEGTWLEDAILFVNLI